MPNIEIPDKLWKKITAQQARFAFPSQTRYWPAVGAIVTRNNAEILLVGNDYGRDELVWNLPGGAVDPGEDLIQAVSRELFEETGLTALEIGPLAWIVQAVLADMRPFIIGFSFEVTAWQGQVSVENEVDHGDVQQAKFVPFDDAVECMIEGNRTALRDWLADPSDISRIYLSTPEGVRKVI